MRGCQGGEGEVPEYAQNTRLRPIWQSYQNIIRVLAKRFVQKFAVWAGWKLKNIENN